MQNVQTELLIKAKQFPKLNPDNKNESIKHRTILQKFHLLSKFKY